MHAAPALASKPETAQFTLDVRDFNYPFARASGNAAAFAAMMKHVTVVGHYNKTVTRTSFRFASCMTGVTCYPDPHFVTGPEDRDQPVALLLGAASAEPGNIWRVHFELPERAHGATLNTVTLVLPVSDLWAEPTVAEDVANAAKLVPSYDQYGDAQKQKTVDIDLIAPKLSSVSGPFTRYCPAINAPQNWNHSGTVSVRMTVQTTAEKLPGQGGDLLKWTPQHGQCLEP